MHVFYLTEHDRFYNTSRAEENKLWFMCTEAARFLFFFFAGGVGGGFPGTIIHESRHLWFCDIRWTSSNRYEPSGGPSSLMIWHEKAKWGFYDAPDKHPKGGKNVQMWRSQRLCGADQHDIGWRDLRGRDNDTPPGLSLLFTVKKKHREKNVWLAK